MLPVELEGGLAMTRDLSVCGVFLESTLTFVLGECLRLTLILEHIDPGGRLCLHCQGGVMHIGPYGIGVGVAVGIMVHRLA
jgi:hypothetical protein